ncbi:hypothetical protein EV207_101293 [Scopulibacillus darangshiensis]|uniref:YqeG family HAD IIIA-type phosphatase n=1 Tax=Scopulibacillus darangshiensis TaxID=442528 RepID=A0A4R2PD34_9BACL|nr:hypothetical protein EV207_101293 [Scopulibacillus darangshiensis]
MLKHFLPNEHANRILDIRPEILAERGIKGIITDLDNTLVAWDSPEATPELQIWFEEMRQEGIKVTIVSNNNEARVRDFSNPIDTPYIYKARKPMTKAFKKAIKDMGLKREEIVVIGDQLLTDVLGGNRLGVYTILVVPVAKSDGWATKFNRKMERYLLSAMKRKGWVDWED